MIIVHAAARVFVTFAAVLFFRITEKSLFLRRHHQPVFGFVFPNVDTLEAAKIRRFALSLQSQEIVIFSITNHHWLVKQIPYFCTRLSEGVAEIVLQPSFKLQDMK